MAQQSTIFFPFLVDRSDEQCIYGKYSLDKTKKFITSEIGFKDRETILDCIRSDYFNVDHIYIIGITYSGGDTQPTLTGKCKFNESILEACNRELAEEIGLYIPNFKHVKYKTKKKFNCDSTTFVVHVSQLEEYNTTLKYYDNYNKDDRTNRIEIAIYGTYIELDRLLKKVYKRYRDETDITGITLWNIQNYELFDSL